MPYHVLFSCHASRDTHVPSCLIPQFYIGPKGKTTGSSRAQRKRDLAIDSSPWVEAAEKGTGTMLEWRIIGPRFGA